MDEPSHAATGWFMLYRGDYRLSPDVPPLWEKWIALAMGSQAIHFDAASEAYRNIQIRRDMTAFGIDVLYHTPGNDGIELVRRGRMMALILGVALAALIGRWAWELGGIVACVAATWMYSLDPNFLGHAALVKNDVAIAFAYAAASYALWRAARKLSWTSALAVVITVAMAIEIKFSGLLLAPVMIVLLGIRAMSAEPWMIWGRSVMRRWAKLGAAFALVAVTAVFTYAVIWAGYGFRFDAGPDGLQLDSNRFLDILRYTQTFNEQKRPPTAQQLSQWTPPLTTRAVLFAQTHHLLPQAWTNGFIITQAGSESRLCYLAGSFYNGGKWYYFPLAALFKAPLASIIAVVLATWCIVRGPIRWRWEVLAIAIPAAAYGVVAITSNINIGLRHAFPIYPFVFIAVGVAAARAWAVSKSARFVIVILAAGLAVETAAAYPNYINFFGVACGGEKAGFWLLSDSNLDWGQDLPALAEWQHQHPDVPLYLDYFGRCDPAAYGIRYFNLPDGYEYGPPPTEPDRAGVAAVSATQLKLLNAYDPPPRWFELIRGRQPAAILNGTIYLFDIPPKEHLH